MASVLHVGGVAASALAAWGLLVSSRKLSSEGYKAENP